MTARAGMKAGRDWMRTVARMEFQSWSPRANVIVRIHEIQSGADDGAGGGIGGLRGEGRVWPAAGPGWRR